MKKKKKKKKIQKTKKKKEKKKEKKEGLNKAKSPNKEIRKKKLWQNFFSDGIYFLLLKLWEF